MNMIDKYRPSVPELFVLFMIWILQPPLLIYMLMAHVFDYKILKSHYLKRKKWDLNISCGSVDGGGINADIVERDVPNFVLVKDIYNLPFKDGQFEDTLCSHTIEHVEDPEKFYSELRRVSKNVVLLVPPLWDPLALIVFREHKWQFLTLRTRHFNSLPDKFRLPYWSFQRKFGQQIRC